jgi:hypothetical protein
MNISEKLKDNLEGTNKSFVYYLWEESLFNEDEFNKFYQELNLLSKIQKNDKSDLLNTLGGELFHTIATILFSKSTANLLDSKANNIKDYKILQNITNTGYVKYSSTIKDAYLKIYSDGQLNFSNTNGLFNNCLNLLQLVEKEKAWNPLLIKEIYSEILCINKEQNESNTKNFQTSSILLWFFSKFCLSTLDILTHPNNNQNNNIFNNLENAKLTFYINKLKYHIHGYFNNYIPHKDLF